MVYKYGASESVDFRCCVGIVCDCTNYWQNRSPSAIISDSWSILDDCHAVWDNPISDVYNFNMDFSKPVNTNWVGNFQRICFNYY